MIIVIAVASTGTFHSSTCSDEYHSSVLKQRCINGPQTLPGVSVGCSGATGRECVGPAEPVSGSRCLGSVGNAEKRLAEAEWRTWSQGLYASSLKQAHGCHLGHLTFISRSRWINSKSPRKGRVLGGPGVSCMCWSYSRAEHRSSTPRADSQAWILASSRLKS